MNPISDLTTLRDALRAFCAARDWHRYHTPKNLVMALSVEAAELVEHFQWATPEESLNLAPENPYLHNMLQFWNPSQFLNFNGLTRLICSLWPFLALPWLMIYRPRRNESDY